MTVFFLLNLPVTYVDRVQEHWYLGVPFELLKHGRMWINHDDPFPENGPHLMYLMAKLTQVTGSLWAVRLAQWPWSLLSAGLLWALLERFTSFSKAPRWELAALSLCALFFWVTLPLGFVYPVQTNGMMSGFSCVVLGILLLKHRPALSMLAFGFAFAAKAQFIMFFPCIMAYRLVFDFDSESVKRHILLVVRDSLLLFVPAVVILPIIFALFGLFQNFHDFKTFAWEGPDLLWAQVSGVLHKVSGGIPADPMVNVRRLDALHAELASYSKLVYVHIALSAGIGVAGLVWTLFSRLPVWWTRRTGSQEPELALLSVMVCIAWITYFKFNNFPYCYNMLPILPFNFFLVPYVLWMGARFFPKNLYWKSSAVIFVALIAFLGVRYSRHFIQDPKGDALKPYYWMEGQAWNSDWKGPQ